MNYKTNQLETADLFLPEHYANINHDFWLFSFTPPATRTESALMDIIKQSLPSARAVVYMWGKKFYALFNKTDFENAYELQNKLHALTIGTGDVMRPHQITNFEDETEIDKRHLAQLLLNSLANTAGKISRANLTGGLYWVVRQEMKKDVPYPVRYVTLKLELDTKWRLKLAVNTFSNIQLGEMLFKGSKKTLNQSPVYKIVHENTTTMFRLYHKERYDLVNTTYVLKQLSNKKSSVPFLDFSNCEAFWKSKSGILDRFLREVETELSPYIQLKFQELPFMTAKLKLDNKNIKSIDTRIQAFYQNKPIVITVADSLKSDEIALKLAKDLYTFLSDKNRKYKVKNVSIGALTQNAMHIRIIKSEKGYQKEKVLDEYLKKSPYLMHHITTDDSGVSLDLEKEARPKAPNSKDGVVAVSSPAIDVILNELYIKNDIQIGKLTILDWSFGDWVFMIKDRMDGRTDAYIYKVLHIDKNGYLVFDSSTMNTDFVNERYEEYKIIYEVEEAKKEGYLNGLIVSNKGDINIITDNNLFTIQEVGEIGEILELESDETDLDKARILTLMTDFESVSPLEKEKEKLSFTVLRQLLENGKTSFSKKELVQKMNEAGVPKHGSNHLFYRFCKFYREQTQDVLKSFLKGVGEKEVLFGSKLDIYYHKMNKEEAVYFVGEKSAGLQSCFQNATKIRTIKAIPNVAGRKSVLVFDKLLQTMSVDFVKYGDYTVLPFPFKYLREYKVPDNQLVAPEFIEN